MGGRPCTIAGDRTWEWPAVWANDGEKKGNISVCVCVCDLGRVVGWASACGGRGYWIGLGPTGAPPHTYFDLLSVKDFTSVKVVRILLPCQKEVTIG